MADPTLHNHIAVTFSKVDFFQTDAFLPHPLYGAYGWVCVVSGPSTMTRALKALHQAHLADQRRVERRGGQAAADPGQG